MGADCADVGVLGTGSGLSPLRPDSALRALSGGLWGLLLGLILAELFLIAGRQQLLLPLRFLLW